MNIWYELIYFYLPTFACPLPAYLDCASSNYTSSYPQLRSGGQYNTTLETTSSKFVLKFVISNIRNLQAIASGINRYINSHMMMM